MAVDESEPGWKSDQIEEIRKLKARYFRGVDSRDWEMLRSVFTEDATIGPMERGVTAEVAALQRSAPNSAASGNGVEAFMARITQFLDRVVTVHHGHQPEIELTGGNDATGIWAMEDVLVWPEAGYRVRGAGHYWETYRREDGVWRIASTRLTRLYTYTERFDVSG